MKNQHICIQKYLVNTRPSQAMRIISLNVIVLLSSMVITMLPSTLFAQAPGVIRVDHFGMNVPDLDQATKFFHDMFGFEPVTQIGPWPMDQAFKKNYHIHETTDQVTIKMLRAGDGSNLELFEYKPTIMSNENQYRDNPAATHLALYTSNINATKSYLESKGIKFLTDVNQGAGDTAGESWVYFETPWGSTIELNSYPDGKGYEKNNPVVTLWSPSNAIDLTTVAPGTEQLRLIVSKQIQILNTVDPAERMKLMRSIYHQQVIFFDHDGVYHGVDGVSGKIDELHKKFTGFKFSLERFDNSYNMIRMYWHLGPKENPKMIAGMDIIIFENNKVRSFNVYIDHLPAKAS